MPEDDGHMVGIEWGQYILVFVFKQCIPQNANFDGANDRALDFAQYMYIYIHIIYISNRQNDCNTNLVLLRLGLSEIAHNLHNR